MQCSEVKIANFWVGEVGKTCLKNDPSYEFIGEVILKINIV
jgi:hypothetical protein